MNGSARNEAARHPLFVKPFQKEKDMFHGIRPEGGLDANKDMNVRIVNPLLLKPDNNVLSYMSARVGYYVRLIRADGRCATYDAESFGLLAIVEYRGDAHPGQGDIVCMPKGARIFLNISGDIVYALKSNLDPRSTFFIECKKGENFKENTEFQLNPSLKDPVQAALLPARAAIDFGCKLEGIIKTGEKLTLKGLTGELKSKDGIFAVVLVENLPTGVRNNRKVPIVTLNPQARILSGFALGRFYIKVENRLTPEKVHMTTEVFVSEKS